MAETGSRWWAILGRGQVYEAGDPRADLALTQAHLEQAHTTIVKLRQELEARGKTIADLELRLSKGRLDVLRLRHALELAEPMTTLERTR